MQAYRVKVCMKRFVVIEARALHNPEIDFSFESQIERKCLRVSGSCMNVACEAEVCGRFLWVSDTSNKPFEWTGFR